MKVDELVDKVGDKVREMESEEDMAEFCMQMSCFCIPLMRGIKGNEFTKGFLKGAAEDNLVIKPDTKH